MAAIAFVFILWWGAGALFLVYFFPKRSFLGELAVLGLAVFWPVVLPIYFLWLIYLGNRKPPKGPIT